MLKHRGFPGRLPSSDFQFTIRRANKKGATPLIRRERFRDRKVADDLAAAKAAHAAADNLEESYRQQSDASRAAAQKAVTDAKDKAAKDAEKRLAKIDAELSDKLSAAEADISSARSSGLNVIDT